MPMTAQAVLTAPSPVVDRLIPVGRASIPAEIRRLVENGDTRSAWTEAWCPLSSQNGCRFGCKVYVRAWGSGFRYAALHSSVYGHRHHS